MVGGYTSKAPYPMHGSRGAKLGLSRPNPISQLQPLVPPQVLHFMQVPFRTSV